jgi:uncharacterized protein
MFTYCSPGDQPMPWIHINDLCGIYEMIIKDENVDGEVINAVSPTIITQKEFYGGLADSYEKSRLFLVKVPMQLFKFAFVRVKLKKGG